MTRNSRTSWSKLESHVQKVRAEVAKWPTWKRAIRISPPKCDVCLDWHWDTDNCSKAIRSKLEYP